MSALCDSTRVDIAHWDECVADAIIIAGSLIPGLVANTITHTEIRNAVAGLHQCHVMALAMQLAHEFARRGLSERDCRQYMLWADVERVMS